MLDTGFYFSGGDAIFQAGRETAQHPARTPPAEIPAPAFPALFVRPRFVQSATVDNEARGREVRGIGEIEASLIIPSNKRDIQNVSWHLSPNDGILPLCLLEGNELPEACLIHGAKSETSGEETAKALRFGTCETMDLDFGEGEVTAHARFRGLADVPLSSISAPALPPPSLAFAPFTWQNVRTISVYGVDVRHVCERVTLAADYTLGIGPYRPWYDTANFSSPWSGTPFGIYVTGATYSATLSFKSADALAWILANGATSSAGTFGMYIENNQGQKLTVSAQHGTRNGSARTNAAGSASTSRLPIALQKLRFEFD